MPLLNCGIILEPDATETIADVIVVPRGAYDSIRAQVIAVPVKTSRTDKLRIDVIHQRDGSYWLQTPKNSDIGEDDNETEFALIP